MNRRHGGDEIGPRRSSAKALVKRAMRLPVAHRFRLAWRLARDRRVPLRARLPLGALVVYLAMPLDIIPDFIPVVGQLDDLLVAGLAVWWFVRTCPPEVAREQIARLEGELVGRIGRLVPWGLAVAGVILAIGAAWWVWAHREERPRTMP